MLREISMQDYEKMAGALAERFAENPEQDLEDLTAKFACAEGMIPDQVRNLVHSLNNMVFLKLFDRDKTAGKDPLGEFPVAQPASVIQKVLSDTPDGMAESACGEESGIDALTDMHGDFPDLLHDDMQEPEGVVVKITIEKAAEAEVEKVAEVSTGHNLIRGQRVQGVLVDRKYACAFTVQDELEKLAYELSRVDAPRLTRVKMLVDALDDSNVKQAFAMTLQVMERDLEKIAADRTPRVYNSHEYPLPELVKIGETLHQLRVLRVAERKMDDYVEAIPR